MKSKYGKLIATSIVSFTTLLFTSAATAAQWVNINSPGASSATFISNQWGDQYLKVYFCREIRNDGRTNVGKAIVIGNSPISSATCYVPHNKKEYKLGNNFEVLVLNEAWAFKDSRISHSLIELDSYDVRTGQATYGCIDLNSAIVGKYFIENQTCYVPESGKEWRISDKLKFKVLSHN